MFKFKPEDFHKVYLQTAKDLNWPVRPECDCEYKNLTPDGKELDIRLARFCDAKVAPLLQAIEVMRVALALASQSAIGFQAIPFEVSSKAREALSRVDEILGSGK